GGDFERFSDISKNLETEMWRGADSNPRDLSGLEGRNSARAWPAIRPDQKHPCWRDSVRLGFGSTSDLYGSLRSPTLSALSSSTHASASTARRRFARRRRRPGR